MASRTQAASASARAKPKPARALALAARAFLGVFARHPLSFRLFSFRLSSAQSANFDSLENARPAEE
jgi:hypothetical protein